MWSCFLETYLAWQRRNEYLGDAGCSNDNGLGDSSEGRWALLGPGVALSTFPFLALTAPLWRGLCYCCLSIDEGKRHREFSGARSAIWQTRFKTKAFELRGEKMDSQRELGRVDDVTRVLQHCAYIFLLLAGKQCNRHLKHGRKEKFDNYSLMLLNRKAGYLRWILTLSKIAM